MNAQKYVEFILARECPVLGGEDPLRFRTSHCIRGIVGECGELEDALKKHLNYGLPLDENNIKEELGDVLFYLCLLSTTIDAESILAGYLPELDPNMKFHFPGKFSKTQLLDFEKHILAILKISSSYKQKGLLSDTVSTFMLLPDNTSKIRNMLKHFTSACKSVWLCPSRIMELNVAKLTARYNKKFTIQECVNRDTDAETKSFSNDDFVQPADY